MPKRNDGNDSPTFRLPRYGDESKQITFTADETAQSSDGVLLEHDYLNSYVLCPAGLTPQTVTGVILRALQLHFSNQAYITREDLRKYTWHEDPQVSQIKILPWSVFRTAQANQLPAIVIKRGQMQSMRQVIGDRSRVNTDEEDKGKHSFYRMIHGTHTVSVSGETDANTELLAMEVFETLTWAGPIIRDNLPFHDFQVTGITEQNLLDSLGNKFGVQLQVQYVFQYGWTTRIVAPAVAGTNLSSSFTAGG